MKTINWGMIGCGSVTEVKSGPGLYKAAHSALHAVTSRGLEKARSFAARHNVPVVYESVEALLADPDIDAVYIATPPDSHKDLALAAARAGKHVCVEKPMALTFEECGPIITACADAGVRLYVAYYRRGMPRFVQIKKWIEEGAIGAVRTVRLVQHQPPADEDRSPETLPWRLQAAISGGGKFLDMGTHMLDMCDFLFGPIAEVRGMAANTGGLYTVEDTVAAVWRHEGGVQGVGSWCYVAGQGEDKTVITGSKGRIEFEFFSDGPLVLITPDGRDEVRIPNPEHVHQPFFQSIVDELNGTGVCNGDVQGAARTSRVADDILRDVRARMKS